jgi:hypothetical protein
MLNSYILSIDYKAKNRLNEELLDAIYEAEVAFMELKKFEKEFNIINNMDCFILCNEDKPCTQVNYSLNDEDRNKYEELKLKFEMLDMKQYIAYAKYYANN